VSKPSKRPSITPAQHARVRQQLGELLKLLNQNQADRALSGATNLVKKFPALAETNHVMAGCLSQRGRFQQALYYAQRASELDPNTADYASALGTILVQANQHIKAIEPLERAISLEPQHKQALSPLAVAYLQSGQIAKARQTFELSIANSPDDPEPAMNLALLESDIANSSQAISLMESALKRFPNNPHLHDSFSMFSCYNDELSPERVFEIHQDFGRCVESIARPPRSYPNTPDPTRRIRIGFISPDFKEHSIAYFVEPIFENLDRDQFELFIYSASTQADKVTARFEKYADTFRTCSNGVVETHKQIVADQPDMLVELTGHFASNQLPIFASKPAPVALTMIGYANTTGLTTIDARIVDEITDPTPTADAFSTERLVRTDGCFLCYRPHPDEPDPTPEPTSESKPESEKEPAPFTFASFNDLRKISPTTVRMWAKILEAAPDSQLVLKSSRLDQPEVCDLVRSRFEALSINPSRIILKGRTKTARDHLKVYNAVDCSLDTFPYTGTTTTFESLWMGVPVVTLMGESHASRVSASILTAIGRSDLIALTQEQYIELALGCAAEGKRSQQDRVAMRTQLAQSPVMDELDYTKKIESVFRDLWKSWCDQQQAIHTNHQPAKARDHGDKE
jgi:protein O-GlcNAc transferase